jgi:hypothetical protein
VSSGVPDTSAIDGGPGDADTRLNCGPAGDALLSWRLAGWTNPYNSYGGSYGYFVIGSDTADGVLASQLVLNGHFDDEHELTLGRGGEQRIEKVARRTCGPLDGCNGSYAYADRGVIYSTDGFTDSALSAASGAVLYSWNRQRPQGADPTLSYPDTGPSASNGSLTVFSANRRWTDTPGGALIAALDAQGGVLWNLALGDLVRSATVDDSGITVAARSHSADIAIDAHGGTLYEATRPASNDQYASWLLQSAGGRLYRGDSTLLDVPTGKPSLVLPFPPIGPAILTADRIIVTRRDSEVGRIAAFDFAMRSIVWERTAAAPNGIGLFAAAGELTLLIDPNLVLHVVRPDGNDAISCQLPPDAWLGTACVLLSGRRLVITRGSNIEAFDLP